MEKIMYKIEMYLKQQVSRGTFLKILFQGLLFLITSSTFLKFAFAKTEESSGRPKASVKGTYDLVLSEGEDPYSNTVKAIEEIGGIERFVKKGSTVVVKPNMAWDRSPAQAANTDPGVVAAIVEMCYKAGAKRVNVFDITCNDERRCYHNSEIMKAAEEKGAKVYYADHWNVAKAHFPYSSQMEGWPILQDAIKCDTFINVPVLKDHGLTRLTLSMKNLMGVCAGTRGLIHMNIGKKLVDLTDFISPDLTVIDATRVLLEHGPSGGNLDDVITLNKVIVSTDPTLADMYACTLVDRDPMSVPYIKEAVTRKFGITDIDKANIKKLQANS